jgi:hypothetical protein
MAVAAASYGSLGATKIASAFEKKVDYVAKVLADSVMKGGEHWSLQSESPDVVLAALNSRQFEENLDKNYAGSQAAVKAAVYSALSPAQRSALREELAISTHQIMNEYVRNQGAFRTLGKSGEGLNDNVQAYAVAQAEWWYQVLDTNKDNLSQMITDRKEYDLAVKFMNGYGSKRTQIFNDSDPSGSYSGGPNWKLIGLLGATAILAILALTACSPPASAATDDKTAASATAPEPTATASPVVTLTAVDPTVTQTLEAIISPTSTLTLEPSLTPTAASTMTATPVPLEVYYLKSGAKDWQLASIDEFGIFQVAYSYGSRIKIVGGASSLEMTFGDMTCKAPLGADGTTGSPDFNPYDFCPADGKVDLYPPRLRVMSGQTPLGEIDRLFRLQGRNHMD